jgi:hypothetical protein
MSQELRMSQNTSMYMRTSSDFLRSMMNDTNFSMTSLDSATSRSVRMASLRVRRGIAPESIRISVPHMLQVEDGHCGIDLEFGDCVAEVEERAMRQH